MNTTLTPARQTRSLRTRDRIVEAALFVFAEAGYQETSMDDICARAGCSKGGLYHHFRTKLEVLAEVAERLRGLDGLVPPLDTVSAATGLPRAALGSLLLDLWAEAARSPALQARLRDPSQLQALDPAALLRIGVMIEERTQALAMESTPVREVA